MKQGLLTRLINRLFKPSTPALPKGWVKTAHGRLVIQSQHSAGSAYQPITGMAAFLSQPRVYELLDQMRPAVAAFDDIVLDEQTGCFYLGSALKSDTAEQAIPLGEIDLRYEREIFGYARQLNGAEMLSLLHQRQPSASMSATTAGQRRDDSGAPSSRRSDDKDPTSPFNPVNPLSPMNPGNW